MWRALPAALVTLALISAEPAGAAAPRGWRDGVAAARAYADGRAGTVAFAVRTERGLAGVAPDLVFDSASVTKAMLLAAYLRQPEVRARALRPADRNLLTPMIRWSSNKDASRVNDLLGAGALDRLARRAGMTAFSTLPECWSCSRITARDQTRFFLRIDRLLPRRHRAYGMGLLERVVPRQRWGVALAAPKGWRLYFKGGWTRSVDHQVALLVRGRRRLAVAVLTRDSPRHAYATETLRGVFDRLLRPLGRARAADRDTARSTAPRRWRAGVAAGRRYAEARAGAVAFAIRTHDGIAGREPDRAFPAASVVKVMLLAAYLRRPGVRGRALTRAERRLLDPMVRRSDDAAANHIAGMLGAGALGRFARRAGMTRFREAFPVWGDSLTTARDQTRLMLAVDRLIPRRHRVYGMGLLRRIVPSQRWGVARAVPRGWTLHFKGGWGSGRGLADHQVALLTRGRQRVSIAVFTLASPSHAYAADSLRGVFRRLLAPVRRATRGG